MRVYIRENLASLSVAVYLIKGDEGQERHIHRPIGGDAWQFEPLPDLPAAEIAPSFTLFDDGARALLDALAAHYGGASDVRQLKADYLAERSRVDKLVDALAATARAKADAEPSANCLFCDDGEASSQGATCACTKPCWNPDCPKAKRRKAPPAIEPDTPTRSRYATHAVMFDKRVVIDWPDGPPLGVSHRDLQQTLEGYARALVEHMANEANLTGGST